MHPSRLVSACFLVVSILLLAQIGTTEPLQATAATVLQASGGIVLFVGAVYGFVRYEANPIVTEYGPMTYVLVFGTFVWATGIAVRLLLG
ncbi:hypothetical protein KY092_14760 [Natronomonas gomsonensis]|jgi:hypothetical protein|nr:hypothetical protein [Natronomonas gomsonensis]